MIRKSISMADQVFDQIEDDIINGKLERGKIVTEGKLAAELGISRTPVREALARLEHDHMITPTGSGMMIVGISDEDAACIYDIRERIEGLAAALAAKNATDEELREMKDTLDLQEYYISKEDFDNGGEMNKKFHEILNKSSKSPILHQTLHELHRKVRRYRKNATYNKNDASTSYKEHVALYDAIAAHDEKRAEELAIEHVRHARVRMVKSMEKSMETKGAAE